MYNLYVYINKNYKSIIIFIIVLCFLVLFLKPMSVVKYAENYSITDLLKVKEIILKPSILTEEMVDKYDMNQDGEITSFDFDIIKQMLLGYYDVYEVEIDGFKAFKDININ